MRLELASWRQRWSWLENRGSSYSAGIVLLIVACLTLVSWIVWQTVPPRWTSPGYPSFVGYGKNVEHAALGCSGLAALLLCLGLPKRWIRLSWTCALLVPALLVTYRYCAADAHWLPPVLIVGNMAYFAWFYRRDSVCRAEPPLTEPWPKAFSFCLFAGACFYVCQQGLSPMAPKMFDQGEVILSAHDWLAGGKPYETMFWPHGLHDTGTTALVTWLTGNNGIGAETLAKSLVSLLGLVCLLIICSNIFPRLADATVAACLVAACFPPFLLWLGNAIFVVLAWQLLARRNSWPATLAAGALLACGYLWRFDCGGFGLAAAAGYVIMMPFYTAYCSSEGGWSAVRNGGCYLAVAARLLALAVGIGGLFLIAWAVLGIPNATLFYVTLWELPKHHADNTGYPLLLPLQGFEQFPDASYHLVRWMTVQTLLFATAVAVFLLLKMREKRLAVAAAEDRFCLMMSLFCMLTIKSLLDRCDVIHAWPVFFVWSLLFLFDLVARVSWPWPATARLSVLAAVTVVCLGGGFLQMLTPGGSNFLPLPRLQLHVRQSLNVLAQCLKPTTRWEEMLEPTAFPDKPQFTEEVRQLRRLLDEHQVGPRGFLAAHSGPLLYPLVERLSPTRYYLLGWAMNERMQREALADLQASQLRAVLRLNGYGTTIPIYDVPDEHRIPLVHEYLANRIADWPSYGTRFGALYVHAELSAGYSLPTSEARAKIVQAPGRTIRVAAEGAGGCLDHLQATQQQVVFAGWAGDPVRGLPAEKILVFLDQRCIFAACPHATRPDVAEAFGKPQLLMTGFDLRLPRRLVPPGSEGRVRLFTLVEDQARELARPQLPAAVAEAAAGQLLFSQPPRLARAVDP